MSKKPLVFEIDDDDDDELQTPNVQQTSSVPVRGIASDVHTSLAQYQMVSKTPIGGTGYIFMSNIFEANDAQNEICPYSFLVSSDMAAKMQSNNTDQTRHRYSPFVRRAIGSGSTPLPLYEKKYYNLLTLLSAHKFLRVTLRTVGDAAYSSFDDNQLVNAVLTRLYSLDKPSYAAARVKFDGGVMLHELYTMFSTSYNLIAVAGLDTQEGLVLPPRTADSEESHIGLLTQDVLTTKLLAGKMGGLLNVDLGGDGDCLFRSILYQMQLYYPGFFETEQMRCVNMDSVNNVTDRMRLLLMYAMLDMVKTSDPRDVIEYMMACRNELYPESDDDENGIPDDAYVLFLNALTIDYTNIVRSIEEACRASKVGEFTMPDEHVITGVLITYITYNTAADPRQMAQLDAIFHVLMDSLSRIYITGQFVCFTTATLIPNAFNINLFCYMLNNGKIQAVIEMKRDIMTQCVGRACNCFVYNENGGSDGYDAHFTCALLAKSGSHKLLPNVDTTLGLTTIAVQSPETSKKFADGLDFEISRLIFPCNQTNVVQWAEKMNRPMANPRVMTASAAYGYFLEPVVVDCLISTFHKLVSEGKNMSVFEQLKKMFKDIWCKIHDRTKYTVLTRTEFDNLTSTEGVVVFPSIMGFGLSASRRRNYALQFNNAARAEQPAFEKKLGRLAMQLFGCMFEAAVRVVFFMVLPPIFDENDNTRTEAFLRVLQEGKHKFNGERSTPQPYHDFIRKAALLGMPMYTENVRTVAMRLVKIDMLLRPFDFVYGAFCEFYMMIIGAMFESDVHSDVSVCNEAAKKPVKTVAAIEIEGRLVHVDAQSTEIEFHEAPPRAPPADATFRVNVKITKTHEDTYTKTHVNGRNCCMLAWFTRTPDLVIKKVDRRASQDGVDSFDRFLAGTRIAYCQVDPQTGSASIPFLFERASLADQGDVFLSLALYVEESEDAHKINIKRRGHAAIRLVDIPKTNMAFDVTLWEGPIMRSISMTSDGSIVDGMQYNATYTLAVDISDTAHAIFKSGHHAASNNHVHFHARGPVKMFDDALVRSFGQYVNMMNKPENLGVTLTNMQSFMYVDIPLDRQLAPSWVSTYFEDIYVTLDVLRARLAMRLSAEGITMEEFEHICAVAFKNTFDMESMLESYAKENYTGSSEYAAYAMDRFMWIYLQVINPYNKICYAFDTFETVRTEQMRYPITQRGDCEDTAQATVQFVNGLLRLCRMQIDKKHRGVIFILKFLSYYTPCMAVIKTTSPSYKTSDRDKPVAEMQPTGLHMLCVNVLASVVKGAKPDGVEQRLPCAYPVETTGLNFGSYITPNKLLNYNTSLAGCRMLLEFRTRYATLLKLAMKHKVVDDEDVVCAYLIADEAHSDYKGDSFITPHYFYGQFINIKCRNVGMREFANNGVNASIGVDFKRVVTETGSTRTWRFVPPVKTITREIDANINKLCEQYAANVQPNIGEIDTVPITRQIDDDDDTAPTERHIDIDEIHQLRADSTMPEYVRALSMRTISFYINTVAFPGEIPLQKIRAVRQHMLDNKKELTFNTHVGPVEFCSELNGTLTYYTFKIKF